MGKKQFKGKRTNLNDEEIIARRIKLNEEEIKNINKRILRYKVIQCSIAVAALFSSSCAYMSYRLAPADGVIFCGDGDVLINKSDLSFDEDIMLPNGRYVTPDGVNKTYVTSAYKNDDDKLSRPNAEVSLLSIAREVDSNHMFLSDRIMVDDDTCVYVKTVPTEVQTIKNKSIIAISFVAGLLSELLLKMVKDNSIDYEESLKSKNRKLKRPLR